MARRVLITGITGFAGSHLAERLVGRGDEVHGIAHEPPPHPNLARVAGHVTIHGANVLEVGETREAVARAQPDVVFHLAGQAVPTLASADPLAAIRINVVGTANVVAALPKGAHLVAASSAEVYGIPDDLPVGEDAPLHPTNVYAATKVAAEAVLRQGQNARVTILRPCNQIGPRQHERLAASEFAKRIAEAEAGRVPPVIRHGQLDPQREFVDVRDMAAAYDAASRMDASGTFNVGSGTLTSIERILTSLCSLARVPIRTELDPERVRAGVADVLLLDSTRFRDRTGWAPAIPLDRSLSDTLDHWREQLLVGSSRPPGAQTEGGKGPRGRAPGPSEGSPRARTT
ncbi:MAG: GDP-mannose 4,6-dehydratase [Chloroflexi bacterium]|nr:GDP-mannose 4,6-dehydratase [Chloroflexota bacterium]